MTSAGSSSQDDAALPEPVRRYLHRALPQRPPLIRRAMLRQSGMLRTGIHTARWLAFTADHVAVPPIPSFAWDARIAMPLGIRLRVRDGYGADGGSGRVSLWSLTLASSAGSPEMNSGALHRYLAEAVWYPTALLPGGGLSWAPLDEHRATATLTDRGTTVSLEFRFDDAGDVTGVYSAGRFGRFDGGFRQVPWEGRFGGHGERGGMRIPLYGEVGWYDDGALCLVWKGDIVEARYELEPTAAAAPDQPASTRT